MSSSKPRDHHDDGVLGLIVVVFDRFSHSLARSGGRPPCVAKALEWDITRKHTHTFQPYDFIFPCSHAQLSSFTFNSLDRG